MAFTNKWISNYNPHIHGKDWSSGGGYVTQQKFVWDVNKHKWVAQPQDDIYVGDPFPYTTTWVPTDSWQKSLEEGLAVSKTKELLEELEKLEKAASEKCCSCNRGGLTSEEAMRLAALRNMLKGIRLDKKESAAPNNNC